MYKFEESRATPSLSISDGLKQKRLLRPEALADDLINKKKSTAHRFASQVHTFTGMTPQDFTDPTDSTALVAAMRTKLAVKKRSDKQRR